MTTKTDEQGREAFDAWAGQFDQYSSEYQDMGADEYFIAGYRAAMQSQDREDAIPANIRLMAERIAADNFEHCTADPIFIVQRKRLITGIVPDYTESIGWFDEDGNLTSGEEAERLEAEYEGTGAEPDGCTRTGYFEEWEHFATYVTMEAAQELVEKKGDQYRVYVDSGCRNHEWKALRAFLLSLAPTRRSIEGDVN